MGLHSVKCFALPGGGEATAGCPGLQGLIRAQGEPCLGGAVPHCCAPACLMLLTTFLGGSPAGDRACKPPAAGGTCFL